MNPPSDDRPVHSIAFRKQRALNWLTHRSLDALRNCILGFRRKEGGHKCHRHVRWDAVYWRRCGRLWNGMDAGNMGMGIGEPSMIGFSLIGALLMMKLWNAVLAKRKTGY